MSKKTIEQTYQKKTQLEHILLRPDSYIGSTETAEHKNAWLFDAETQKMVRKDLHYVPGLYKIFDEILVNAADNRQRDNSMNMIKVDINQEEGVISVWNNGKGIPVEMHAEHNMWVPELVFGHLLTSSNYDDEEKKTTGGRNGYGAKLTNIFSTEFVVKTYDSNSGKSLKKTWTNNMQNTSKAVIVDTKGIDFTSVTFKPDLSKFGLTRLDDDIVAVMKKRVWDIAGCTDKSLKVKLNGVQLPVSDFKDYVNLYPVGEAIKNQQIETVGRWTVCVTTNPFHTHQHCSFVNSIWTSKGGRHVDSINDQIVSKVTEKLKKKKIDAKPAMIKNHLWVFINTLIENPAFDSQTKENMTTPKTKFGSVYNVSDKLLDALCKGDLLQKVMDNHAMQADKDLNNKVKGKKKERVSMEKYEQANRWRQEPQKCTLVLTEGDSAKSLAISGFSIVGRDYWGVFPLRGKLLNVRDAAPSVILKNQEVQNVMKILGLRVGTKYMDTSQLNYGHLMIMADQDHDGSHIKGLLVNFVHHFWPELLLHCPGFLMQFITPIVKVTKGPNVKSFYSLPEYRQWQESSPDYHTWKAKYYKGLGTSRPQEAKEYFAQLDRHKILFDYNGAEDHEAILLAFDKSKIEDRKAWVTRSREENLDFNVSSVSVADFVNKELVLFSRADCERSIPNVMDGFKPSQRKILFCCFKKKGLEKSEIKVAQLSGYVSEHSAYHHGEASLQGTIIGMAQDFCGSNNINLLEPSGQFGTRITGGKDASQPRYLFTKLTPLARAIFPAHDDELLDYKEDDGLSVEPHWYAPIIPMVLVNGCRGIGTGYATSIPNHNPATLIEWIRCRIKGKELPQLIPWYRDFTNNDRIRAREEEGAASFRCYGTIREVGSNNTVVNITELPVEKWTEDYKNFLEGLLKEEIIHDFQEYHTDVKVDFEIQMDPATLQHFREVGLEEKFKLRSSIPVSNLVCFDHNGSIAKYDSTKDIVEEFYQVRSEYYRKRKDLLIDKLTNDCEKLKNMVRFVTEVVSGSLVVMKRKKKDMLGDLKTRKYKAFPPEVKRTIAKGAVDYDAQGEDDEGEEGAQGDDADQSSRDYDYLLGMKIWSLTYEKIEELKAQLAKKEEEFNILYKTEPSTMWLRDLDNLEKVHNAFEAKRKKALAEGVVKVEKKGGGDGGKVKAKGQKAKQSLRLQESSHVPKQSEKAKKLVEEYATKQAKESDLVKKREALALKRLLKGEKEESSVKRAKKEPDMDTQMTLASMGFSSASQDSADPPLSPKAPKAKATSPAAADGTIDLDMDDDPPVRAPPAPKTMKKPPAARPAAPKPPPKPKASPKKKKTSVESDDESDDSEVSGADDGDDDDFEAKPRPQRSTRERKPVTYTLASDSSEDDEDNSDDNDDDNDDSDAPAPPKKKAPAKKAAPKKRLQKNQSDDDDDDDSFRFD
uniref:DNA topoisomerase 2 n=1 Tax=Eutreptiella gymnastica TaxID=73025 RepID=A0A7S1ITT9_9EUGL